MRPECVPGFFAAAFALSVVGLEPDPEGQCRNAGDGTCSSTYAALRWRGFPYYVSHPKFARTIYGGDYIKAAFEAGGFAGPAEGEDWDVLWTHRSQHHKLIDVTLPPRAGQRLVNHCDIYAGAGDKCAFSRISQRAAQKTSSDAGYMHFRSYQLDKPEQYELWRKEVSADPSRYWVLKPCSAGGSQGIQVERGEDALLAAKQGEPHSVAQEYLDKPFLGFGGQKFHFRMYMFVTRWAPAAVYLYDEGLVFRSLKPFQETPSVSRDIFSGISQSVEALPISEFWNYLDASPSQERHGIDAATIRSRIKRLLTDLIENDLADRNWAGRTRDAESRKYGCFDLFGADVILDKELRPFVMEINDGPNMWVSNHGKKHEAGLSAVKDPMIKQVVNWLSQRARQESTTAVESDTLERMTLLNFTRLI